MLIQSKEDRRGLLISLDAVGFRSCASVGVSGGESKPGVRQIVMISTGASGAGTEKKFSGRCRIIGGSYFTAGALCYAIGIVSERIRYGFYPIEISKRKIDTQSIRTVANLCRNSTDRSVFNSRFFRYKFFGSKNNWFR